MLERRYEATMPRAKSKDISAGIISATVSLVSQESYSDVTLERIADVAGQDITDVRKVYETKEEVLHDAYRRGQKDMETRLREPITGDLNAHLEVLFDALMDSIKCWGPEQYMGMLYWATKDPALQEMVMKATGRVNFAVKAFLAEMVALRIVEQVDQVERVNREFVSSFIEGLAGTLEGKKVPAIKKAWVKRASGFLKPSPLTNIPARRK